MCFGTFEIALFSNFRALCAGGSSAQENIEITGGGGDNSACPGGDLETCQGVCPDDPEVLDLCFAECEERCPKPEPLENDPNAEHQCPGGDLDTCIDVCPGFNKVAFGLCVAECGERCP